jgi:hypothetical protein
MLRDQKLQADAVRSNWLVREAYAVDLKNYSTDKRERIMSLQRLSRLTAHGKQLEELLDAVRLDEVEIETGIQRQLPIGL